RPAWKDRLARRGRNVNGRESATQRGSIPRSSRRSAMRLFLLEVSRLWSSRVQRTTSRVVQDLDGVDGRGRREGVRQHKLVDQVDAVVRAEHRARLGGGGADERSELIGGGGVSGRGGWQPHASTIARRRGPPCGVRWPTGTPRSHLRRSQEVAA